MSKPEDQLGKLSEESLKRKDRLKQLKEKADKVGKLPKPIFRSYKPQDENTKGEICLKKSSDDIEESVSDQLDLLKQAIVIDDIDVTNLAPRKPDWDLKRDVSKKLERLDRRTQKAIAELIRDRLKKNQEGQEIFQVVNIATAHVDDIHITT